MAVDRIVRLARIRKATVSGSSSNFESLRAAVLNASERPDWSHAVHEWEVVGLEEDPAGHGICICGQLNLVKLFTIKNMRTGVELFPIGSSCINLFDRPELDYSASVLADFAKISQSLRKSKAIALDTEHFSRALLEYLHSEGAFTPDQYNGFDGESDLDFMLTMFNKRIKEDITQAQQRKIYMVLRNKVFPFVLNDQRIR